MAVRKEYRVGGVHNYVIDYQPQADGTIQMKVPVSPYDPYKKPGGYHHLMANKTICVTQQHRPRNMTQAEKIAKAWAESYSNYVRSGTFGPVRK